jgi:hypothetical protein
MTAPRRRGIFEVSFEHKYLNAAADYLNVKDQTSAAKAEVSGHGWSGWLTPKYPIASKPGASVEALLRFDDFKPNTATSQERKRQIIGVAYWFPHQGGVSSAIMLDYDNGTFDNFTPVQPTQRRIAVHGLINF